MFERLLHGVERLGVPIQLLVQDKLLFLKLADPLLVGLHNAWIARLDNAVEQGLNLFVNLVDISLARLRILFSFRNTDA
jgi:hypothetical protein